MAAITGTRRCGCWAHTGRQSAARPNGQQGQGRPGHGSVDFYLGRKAPDGKEANWVPNDPARKFELLFRVYGPENEFFEKKWVLPDVEEATQ